MIPVMLSLGVLAAALLIGFGLRFGLRGTGADRTRGWLMVAVGIVTLINVWLWAGMPATPQP